jgi:hypothetical protein
MPVVSLIEIMGLPGSMRSPAAKGVNPRPFEVTFVVTRMGVALSTNRQEATYPIIALYCSSPSTITTTYDMTTAPRTGLLDVKAFESAGLLSVQEVSRTATIALQQLFAFSAASILGAQLNYK